MTSAAAEPRGRAAAAARRGVLCAGSIVVDYGKVIDSYPGREQLAMIESMSVSTGGPGLNLAADLSRLGAPFPIALVGAVGDDANGKFVLDACARAGIDSAGVRTVPGAATSFTDAMVERDGGRRTFFHHPGANARFDPADVDVAGSRAAILHCGAPGIHPVADSFLPEGGNGWSTLLARGRAAGLHTNLELVPLAAPRMRELALPCLPHLDSIIINELEAGALTGLAAETPGPDGPVDWVVLTSMARALVDLGVHRLAVVHFPAGCVAAAPDGESWRQGSVRLAAESVVSTTGAGDAFAAGVIFGLHERWPIPECLRLGVATAAASVMSPLTSDGVRPVAACLAMADAAGHRPTGWP